MDIDARGGQPFNITNLDREGLELRIGDRVGFIMRGWFQVREQETFGIITEIDDRGGIKIEVNESYKRFTSSGLPLVHEKIIYFTHHVYDAARRARIYARPEGLHLLSIFKVPNDEIEWHLREAAATKKTATRASRAD